MVLAISVPPGRGRQLVKQALFGGHQVKAFGRNVFTEFNQDEKTLNW